MALIAGGNIVSATGSVLDTSNATGNGGDISLIAGANFTGTAPNPVTVNSGAGSGTGGLIDLTGGNGGTGAVTTITSSGGGAGKTSGYIEMVAYHGTGTGSGTITAPSALTINAQGTNGATDGDVKVIAGATTGNAINVGTISGHNIDLETFTPNAPGAVTFTGGLSNQGINGFTTTGTIQPTNIFAGNINASGNITVNAGGNFTADSLAALGTNGQAGNTMGSLAPTRRHRR